MKKFTTAVPAALIALGLASAAHAQSGTITFNGEVTSVTCEVSFNGVVGTNPSITLPTVATVSLLEGTSAGRTPVLVHVGGNDPICQSGAVVLALNTNRSAYLRNGRLGNMALAAAGTSAVVGLRDANDQLIDLGAGWASPVAAGGGNGTDITFHAEYYADGGDAVAGVFQAPLEYTLVYP